MCVVLKAEKLVEDTEGINVGGGGGMRIKPLV